MAKLVKINNNPETYFVVTTKLISGFVIGQIINKVNGSFVSRTDLLYLPDIEDMPTVEMNTRTSASVTNHIILDKVSKLIDRLL